MERQIRISEILRELEQDCPGGFALAFHIKYATPDFLFQTYPSDWIEVYSHRGLVMQDPTVRWGFENTGWIRWSDLTGQDDAGVLALAAEHGLSHGVCHATDAGESRSVASAARGDREYTDAEIAAFCALTEEIHELTADLDSLSPQIAEELRRMSIRFTHPGSTKI